MTLHTWTNYKKRLQESYTMQLNYRLRSAVWQNLAALQQTL